MCIVGVLASAVVGRFIFLNFDDNMSSVVCSSRASWMDFELFNLAMLAKQAWRFLTTPSSPCACVLKARYSKDSDFMLMTYPEGSSYTLA